MMRRTPLYEKYADLIIDVDGLTIAQAVEKMSKEVKAATWKIKLP